MSSGRKDIVLSRILRGNLAPGGAVSKITGKEGLTFTGKARVFDSEDDMVRAVENGELKTGKKTVVVLRYLGPKGGPGMQVYYCFSSYNWKQILFFFRNA